MKIAVAVLASNLEPWNQTIVSHQKPAFLSQESTLATPFWLYCGWDQGSFSRDFQAQDARLLRDKYNDYMYRITGYRHVRTAPGKSSEAFRTLLEQFEDGLELRGSDVFCSVPDALSTLGFRTLEFMEYLLSFREFEYLFRTNTSSFVNFSRLAEFVEKLPAGAPLYAGYPVSMGQIHFASGAGMLLSRSVVEGVVKNRARYDFSYLDDQSFGLLIRRMKGVHLTSLERITFQPRAKPANFLQTINGESADRPEVFHWRCKSDNPIVERMRLDYLAQLFSSKDKG